MAEIPQPFLTVWWFVKQKKEPYHTILMHVHSDLARARSIYHINPDQIYEKLRKQEKLKIEGTNRDIKIGTVRRTLYAVIYGKRLEKDVDYLVTSGARGRKHLKFVNTPRARAALRSLI
jgi:hypothetical protein